MIRQPKHDIPESCGELAVLSRPNLLVKHSPLVLELFDISHRTKSTLAKLVDPTAPTPAKPEPKMRHYRHHQGRRTNNDNETFDRTPATTVPAFIRK